MSLVDDLPVNVVTGIDSAAFIYFIEGPPLYAPLLVPLFEQRLERNENRAITSVVALAEVLVQPLRTNRQDLVEKYRDFLGHGPLLSTARRTSSPTTRASRRSPTCVCWPWTTTSGRNHRGGPPRVVRGNSGRDKVPVLLELRGERHLVHEPGRSRNLQGGCSANCPLSRPACRSLGVGRERPRA
jgi:hypothetical protein